MGMVKEKDRPLEKILSDARALIDEAAEKANELESKPASSAFVEDLASAIDKLHDTCDPKDRNSFYSQAVSEIRKYTGALNAKIELNISNVNLPKDVENHNLK